MISTETIKLTKNATKKNREYLEKAGYGDTLIYTAPMFAQAFIGLTNDRRVAYSFQKIVTYIVFQSSGTDVELIKKAVMDSEIMQTDIDKNMPVIIID
jgi:hypothetical protein